MQGSLQQLLAFRVFTVRDTDAYRRLYEEYDAPIRRFLAAKLRRREDVDELCSEVFLRGWEYMTANRVENPRALFYRVAHNLIVDHYRASSAVPESVLVETLEEVLPDPSSLVEEVATKQEMSALLEKLRQLKKEYQEVLLMKYVQEFSVEEIAGALQKSSNAIRVLLFRAKRALRKL